MTSIKGDERSKDGTKQGGMGGRDRERERERELERRRRKKKTSALPFLLVYLLLLLVLEWREREREREEFLVTLFLLVFTAKDWPFLRSPSLLACAFTPQTNEE